MAQEAKGTNGKILGSLNYFTKLNEKLPNKSIMKDKTKGNYFYVLGNSAPKVKKALEGTEGKKMKTFLETTKNTICTDIKNSASKGEYATFEHREAIRNTLKQLNSCDIYDEIKKLRKLEDFHKKIISLDFRGAQYPIEVWLEWKNGKNILHIHLKLCFKKRLKDGTYITNPSDEIYITDGLDEIIETKKQLIQKGFQEWAGNYKVFNSIEEGKQDLEVKCDMEEIYSDSVKSLSIIMKEDFDSNRSFTSFFEIWSPESQAVAIHMHHFMPYPKPVEINGKMDLEDSFTYRSSESYSGAAKHELGHALGLREGYGYGWNHNMDAEYYEQFADIQEDVQEIGEPIRDEEGYANMVMVNNGPVLNNDIEMLILAWKTKKAQYYYGNNISEAMGR